MIMCRQQTVYIYSYSYSYSLRFYVLLSLNFDLNFKLKLKFKIFMTEIVGHLVGAHTVFRTEATSLDG